MAAKECIPPLADVYACMDVVQAWCVAQAKDIPFAASDVQTLALSMAMDLLALRFLMDVEGLPC